MAPAKPASPPLRSLARSSVISRNIVANAVSQGWAIALGILALPIYLELLGVEYYALIGFGITVQVMVNMIDAGFSPALGRDVARMRAGLEDPGNLALFLRSLDWLFAGIVAILSVGAILSSDWWATDWFAVSGPAVSIVGESVTLIIIASALRCMAALYRGAIVNLEKQIFTSGVVAAVNAVRLLLPIPFVLDTPDPRIVFAFWLAAAIGEVALLRVVLSRNLATSVGLLRFSFSAIKTRMALAGGVALLAVAHTFATQYDKLILSRLLSLEEYGYFTLAVVLSGAMLTLPAPVVQAIQPRITGSFGRDYEQRELVRITTQLIMILVVAPAIALAAVPQSVLFGWTGNLAAAAAVAPYLGFYLVGSALVGVSSAAYMLQLAAGNMRLHIIANLCLIAVLVPAIYLIAQRQGAAGTAHLWFALNAIFVITYVPFAVNRMLPHSGWRWLREDLLLPACAAVLAALVFRWLIGDSAHDRILAIAQAAGALMATMAATASGTVTIRRFILAAISNRHPSNEDAE